MKVVFIAAILAASLGAYATAQQSAILAPLDTGVNALLQTAGAPNTAATKVVPIVGSGGTQSGFAQVVGPQNMVKQIRAVAEIRTQFGGAWDVQALIPVTTVSRSGAIHRVYGVSVDAVIGMHP